MNRVPEVGELRRRGLGQSPCGGRGLYSRGGPISLNRRTLRTAMPLYEYECTACHHLTEKIQKYSDADLTVCPRCGGPLERTITAAAMVFKGGGWYKDGYASVKHDAPSGGGDSGASGSAANSSTEGVSSGSGSGESSGSGSGDSSGDSAKVVPTPAAAPAAAASATPKA
jgi:putative FmdB family regulatory protein